MKSGSDAKLVALLTRAAAADDNNQCMIKLFGNEITTASFAMYTFSTAVFVQAIILASIGAIADHGKNLDVEGLVVHANDHLQGTAENACSSGSELWAPSQACSSFSSSQASIS